MMKTKEKGKQKNEGNKEDEWEKMHVMHHRHLILWSWQMTILLILFYYYFFFFFLFCHFRWRSLSLMVHSFITWVNLLLIILCCPLNINVKTIFMKRKKNSLHFTNEQFKSINGNVTKIVIDQSTMWEEKKKHTIHLVIIFYSIETELVVKRFTLMTFVRMCEFHLKFSAPL